MQRLFIVEAYISKKSYAAYLEYGFPVLRVPSSSRVSERLRRSFVLEFVVSYMTHAEM
jgi:hypothetical protein